MRALPASLRKPITVPSCPAASSASWTHPAITGCGSASTPTVLQWALGIGASAVSLATADSLTAAGRAPRRLTLGVQTIPVGTAIGGAADKAIARTFGTPLMVPAGTFLHVILKMPVGTATASQVIRGTVGIDGFFE